MRYNPDSFSQLIEENVFDWVKLFPSKCDIYIDYSFNIDQVLGDLEIDGRVPAPFRITTISANEFLIVPFIRDSICECIYILAKDETGKWGKIVFVDRNAMNFTNLDAACLLKDNRKIADALTDLLNQLIVSAKEPESKAIYCHLHDYIKFLYLKNLHEHTLPEVDVKIYEGENTWIMQYSSKPGYCHLDGYATDTKTTPTDYLNNLCSKTYIPETRFSYGDNYIFNMVQYSYPAYVFLYDRSQRSSHERMNEIKRVQEFRDTYPEAPF